jgi:hypothetical protein
MRSMSLTLAIAVPCTWSGALGAELPIAAETPETRSPQHTVALWTPQGRVEFATPAVQGPIPIPVSKPLLRQPPPETICRMIEKAAREHAIPAKFLTRLIWQESRFRVSAVSHAGAQGIAQFMPATAAERDLKDPFDPKQALWAAASLLSSLKQRFGNLGLAAAAYNAGPGRVSDWLRKRKRLPKETRNYVRAITGRPARTWAKAAKKKALSIVADDGNQPCVAPAVAMASNG